MGFRELYAEIKNILFNLLSNTLPNHILHDSNNIAPK